MRLYDGKPLLWQRRGTTEALMEVWQGLSLVPDDAWAQVLVQALTVYTDGASPGP